ncbi:complement factor H-related protein 1 [Xenopus laevis]|uniref:Sushi domain-containing protein n=2 Tax=Xenopus laevis TaxID=8355 RepID=A0A974CAW9_XENLA|nr:complement factor H-related protein 1 [Xenopus laevis]OCT69306.1 hypothetical protein XELAEV_18040621mg [Xenopus laevis]
MSFLGSFYVFASILCCVVVGAQRTAQLCDEPELQNGEFRYWYSFPLSTLKVIEYICHEHYVPLNKTNESDTYGVAKCTENGWDPRPKCLGKPCSRPPVEENGYIIQLKDNYTDGESAKYVCNVGYEVAEHSEAQCLNGQWINIPTCVSVICGPAPIVGNARLVSEKAIYQSLEKATYECDSGFVFHTNKEALCKKGQWIEIPECRKQGASCGPPPVVQAGDTLMPTQATNRHGSVAPYICANYYVLEGNPQVTCRNGKWDDPPVCIEPCVVIDKDLRTRNTDLRWKVGLNKMYLRHHDFVSFRCLDGYEISDTSLLRVKCISGTINYPTCTKLGQGESCGKPPVVQYGDTLEPQMKSHAHGSVMTYKCPQMYILGGEEKVSCRNGKWEEPPVCIEPCTVFDEELKANNLRLKWVANDKLYMRHGEVVSVGCVNGYEILDEGQLRVPCNNGVLLYPKCHKYEGCGYPPNVPHGDTIQPRLSFNAHGSFMEYRCPEYYKLEGPRRITCRDGIWDDPPVCIEPCTVSDKDLKANNLRFKWFRSREKLYTSHEDLVAFLCIDGYEIPDERQLRVQCRNGVLSFPTCHRRG